MITDYKKGDIVEIVDPRSKKDGMIGEVWTPKLENGVIVKLSEDLFTPVKYDHLIKHEHRFNLESDIVDELSDNPFHLPEDVVKSIGPTLVRVVTYRCKCGATQEFHSMPEEKNELPNEFIIKK